MRITQYILVERLKQAYRCDSLPWIRAQLLVKSGERDAMVTIPTNERRQYADVSALPVVTLNMRMFVANDSPRYGELSNAKTLDDLKAGTFIAQAGSGWAKKQIEPRHLAIEWAGNIENVFRMLKTRRGDFTIQGDIYAMPILKALAFEDQISITPVIFDRADYHLLISKQSAQRELMQRFDAELKTMTADGRLTIVTQQAMQAISDEMSSKYKK
ncbi:transporter substrate-binding domain-containing protein [Permianibacter sp. IMCC34836]|uniref:substrate-binding periplasmic protein n=1 Tax=Permianibacter fluminis TaxID=2738515 RepID=UPI001552B698|nr:transporter substrate-binding domain-containing protein [Permianibacter fluminis]NQD36750.1 transporter substrate-binding domain-containing protein [Permianibacter fluminis]